LFFKLFDPGLYFAHNEGLLTVSKKKQKIIWTEERYIIDAKWKLIDANNPSDDDWIRVLHLRRKAEAGDKETARIKEMENTQMMVVA